MSVAAVGEPAPVDPGDAEALDAYSRAVMAVAERLTPSVASLRVMRRSRGGQVPAGAGSAVVLTPDGFLLTSAHVVGRSSGHGRAGFADGREDRFEVVGRDQLSDLAVVRADGDGFVEAELGDADAPAGRPARGGHRQPARLQRLGHGRRGVRPRPVAAGALAPSRARDRQRDPDRRRAQSRQLGRRARRQPRARGGREHGGGRHGPRARRADERQHPAGDLRADARGPRAPGLPRHRRRAAPAASARTRRARCGHLHRGGGGDGGEPGRAGRHPARGPDPRDRRPRGSSAWRTSSG